MLPVATASSLRISCKIARSIIVLRSRIRYFRAQTFKVRHRTREAMPIGENPATVESDTGVKQRRALIVDDEPALVNILKIYLQDEGFAVTMALDGAEGLKTALAEPFDVVLL